MSNRREKGPQTGPPSKPANCWPGGRFITCAGDRAAAKARVSGTRVAILPTARRTKAAKAERRSSSAIVSSLGTPGRWRRSWSRHCFLQFSIRNIAGIPRRAGSRPFCKQRRSRSRNLHGSRGGQGPCQFRLSSQYRSENFPLWSPLENALPPCEQCIQTRSQTPRCRSACHTPCPAPASGLMYAAVPRITPCIVAAALSVGELEGSSLAVSPAKAFAKPKSNTFTLPSGVTFTLAGFKSR